MPYAPFNEFRRLYLQEKQKLISERSSSETVVVEWSCIWAAISRECSRQLFDAITIDVDD
jgi:hypothetical protein